MRKRKISIIVIIIILVLAVIFVINFDKFRDKFILDNVKEINKIKDNNFIIYKPDLENQNIKMYWKSADGTAYSNLKSFIKKVDNDKIRFITNGGIYTEYYTPEGLYIEDYKIISELNLNSGTGNFYLEPNGVFYIEDGIPRISVSKEYKNNKGISYAVQSGPVLIKDGKINEKFGENSESLKIRSAVGIDKENNLFFLMSETKINFYYFSKYALDILKCKDLLFLDGTISKMYFDTDSVIPNQKYPFVVIITAEDK